jgi:RHS repeat-associated protein
VWDSVPVGSYPNDIDDQTNTSNYAYDGTGNMISDASQGVTVTWSPYGKILEVNKTVAPAVKDFFGYDPMQNRVLKGLIKGTDTTKTYYIRDAQGNVMAVYTRRSDTLRWVEQHLYGSGRLGMYRQDTAVNKGLKSIAKMYEGKRQYELSNHLGNVLTVISDRRTYTISGTTKIYDAVVISAQDYYPFGLSIDSRSFTAVTDNSYRYSFNGKEGDKEIGTQDYGARIYNLSIGRFLSVDPISREFAELSTYQFASNSPLIGIDLDGLELQTTVEKQQAKNAPTLAPPRISPPAPMSPPPAPPQKPNIPGKVGEVLLEGLSYIGKGALMTVALVFTPPFDQMKTRSEFPPSYYSNIKLSGTTDPYQLTREKRADKYEAKRIKMEKDDEPPHILYKLIAKEDGVYPCPSCPASEGGSIYLKKGEVWKYGVTSKGSVAERYKYQKLGNGISVLKAFDPIPLESGSESRMKIREKQKTVGYYAHPENINRETDTGLRLYRPPGQVKDK